MVRQALRGEIVGMGLLRATLSAKVNRGGFRDLDSESVWSVAVESEVSAQGRINGARRNTIVAKSLSLSGRIEAEYHNDEKNHKRFQSPLQIGPVKDDSASC